MNFRRVHPVFKILLAIFIAVGIVCFTASVFVNSRAKANIVRFSYPPSGLVVQFELPEGYGALEQPEGEGAFLVNYSFGKLDPESGAHVILSTPDGVRIIPSYDSSIVTLEDWRKKGGEYDEADALNVQQMEVAGVPAEVLTFGGMGETRIIQFVKDKNYFEISTEGSLNDKVISKIISTFTFVK